MLGIQSMGGLYFEGLSSLKRDILFYDNFLLLRARTMIGAWRGDNPDKDTSLSNCADELEYLLETQYFSEQEDLSSPPEDADPEVRNSFSAAAREYLGYRQAILDANLPVVPHSDVAERWRRLGQLMARMESVYQTLVLNKHASAVGVRIAEEASTTGLGAGEVIQLAIRKVSMPDERTPWADILALKEDRDLQERARKLRLWSSKILKPGMTLAEADEYVKDSLSDYENYLRAHRMKFVSGSLESAVVGASEVLEELAKLKIGKLAARLFSARATQAEMLLSEMKAPGRELSLVTIINEKLRRS